MERKHCRLWWPNHLSSGELPSSDFVLFGWFLDSSNSIDVVIAHVISTSGFSVIVGQSDLQEILKSTNSNMPMPLKRTSTFCIIGHCAAHYRDMDMKTVTNKQSDPFLESKRSCGSIESVSTKPIRYMDTNEISKSTMSVAASEVENHGCLSCGCGTLDHSIEPYREALIRHGNWIQLLPKSQGILCKESRWVPRFHHMHQNGHIMSNCDVHVSDYI